jgi:hypothetical protein
MRVNQSEIIDDVLQHIQKCGGDLSEWWVGTAGTIQEGRFKIPDEAENGMPKRVYREAYTPYAADGVIDYLKGLGLHSDPRSTRGSCVFVYRPVAAQEAARAGALTR